MSLSATADHYQDLLWTTSGDGSFVDASSLTAVYTPGSKDILNGAVDLTIRANEISPCITNAAMISLYRLQFTDAPSGVSVHLLR